MKTIEELEKQIEELKAQNQEYASYIATYIAREKERFGQIISGQIHDLQIENEKLKEQNKQKQRQIDGLKTSIKTEGIIGAYLDPPDNNRKKRRKDIIAKFEEDLDDWLESEDHKCGGYSEGLGCCLDRHGEDDLYEHNGRKWVIKYIKKLLKEKKRGNQYEVV